MKKYFLFISLTLFSLSHIDAATFPIRSRVFLGASEGKLSNVNTELRNLGLEEMGSVPFYGAELTYKVLPIVEVGLNYLKRQNTRKSTATSSSNYGAEFDQNIFLGILRIPFIKTSVLRIDVFAGIGGSNTKLKINTASVNGEVSKKDSKEFVASFTSRYGASVGAGFKGVYFYVEGGYEDNKVNSLDRTGNINTNISSIDMSGTYGLIGLQFDAPEIFSK